MHFSSSEHYISRRSPVAAPHGAVAASQPLAATIGCDVLRDGGNAADAAVATAAALQVTVPCQTGLGGDLFALFYDAGESRVYALNGSGRSPAALDLARLEKEGLRRALPATHAHTVTVPGAPQAWHDLSARFGSKPLSKLLAPSIALAANGFAVAPLAAEMWQAGEAKLRASAHGAELLPGGHAPTAGQLMQNRTLAHSLRTLASEGPEPFYRGEIARRIAEAVQQAGGVLAMEDLAEHRGDSWVEPISLDYAGVRVWECPPNGQGLAALMALNALRTFELPATAEPVAVADRYHVAIECMRQAFADAAAHIADPEHTNVPVEQLLEADYGQQRAAQIDPRRAHPEVAAGVLREGGAGSDTVYFCTVDAAGNGCSVVNSNYMGFGTGIVPQGCGFTLQNRGAGFSHESGHPNQLAPRKRPYHTIIPALATDADSGRLRATFGVMGGMMQPQGHLQVACSLFHDGVDPQAALDRPRFQLAGGSSAGDVLLERGLHGVADDLRRRGHTVRVVAPTFGRGQIIGRSDEEGAMWWTGSDPRGDGYAAAVPSAP